jgi:phosphatidylinositol 4-kinase
MMTTLSMGSVPPERHPEIFYRQTIFRIARNWARVSSAPWAKVRDPLFTQCPNAVDHEYGESETPKSEDAAGQAQLVLDESACASLIGLGLYFLESTCRHGGQIVPYLLRVEGNLLNVLFKKRKAGPNGNT